MAESSRSRGPFASPRVSVTSISVDCHLEFNASADGLRNAGAKPGTGGTTPPGSRGVPDSNKRISSTGGVAAAGTSPLGRQLQPPRTAYAVSSPIPPNAAAPPSSRPSAAKQALAQQLMVVSPTARLSRAKITPETASGTLEEISGSGPLSTMLRVQLPPGSPLAGTPSGSFRGSRVWDAVPGVEHSHPQQPSPAPAQQLQQVPQKELSGLARTASASLSGAAAFGGAPPLLTSPSFKASAAPAGPGVVVVKDAVKLVVHHYRSADDDSEEEDGGDTSRQASGANDGGPPQPQGPQVSGLVRFLAVLCCMAPAQPQRKKRRRRSRKPSALSSEVLAPEEHLIGAHQSATDFKGKYQKAQAKAHALVPVPALKRCASNAGFAALPPAEPSGYGTSTSGTATDGARTVSGGPRQPYQASPFATHSVPNGASPVTRTTSLRSPGDVRLGGMRSSPLQSQSVDGYMEVGGWSPVGTAGGGGDGGGGRALSGALSGGSPQYTGNLMINGDSGGGLSRISSFDGRSSSGQPTAPVEPSERLVQCFKLELAAGVSASLDGAGSMTPDALSSRHHERTMTGGSVSGYGGKRGVRWQ